MSLSLLNVHNLRNIASASYDLHPQFNVFYGANGSGKTSILEALYLLSCGHSFRTREITPLIRYEQSTMTLFARTQEGETVSIQKTNTGQTQIKINQHSCVRTSDLAHFLPCQVFYQDLFQIIDAGPSIRRNLLDWGLFHVKQSYHAIWKDYQRVLKQRNALLRQRAQRVAFKPWDELLVALSEQLHQYRHDYFTAWSHQFTQTLSELTSMPCTIDYYRGWDKKNSGQPLATLLNEQFNSDTHHQYTQIGAHQADIVFHTSLKKAKHTLSRGQQKIILIALKLAQTHLMNQPCLYLLDDITAELDQTHTEALFQYLQNMRGQFFVTSINKNAIPLSTADGCYVSLSNGEAQ